MANGGIIGPIQSVQDALSEKVTAITSSGCFSPQGATSGASVLVVAGGGSGAPQGGGGGGAGGFRLLACQTLPGSTIPITIGAGGAGVGGPAHTPGENPGNKGSNSVFGNPANPITSAGGGAGIFRGICVSNGNGGSGGGSDSHPIAPSGGSGNNPPVSPPQGNPGGKSSSNGDTPHGSFTISGGGGGAGGAGGAANLSSPSSGTGGAGGNGSPVTSTFGCAPQPFYGPTNGVYAGGGGGGAGPSPGVQGAGGPGGGTAGVSTGNSSNATANTGGGSGGTVYYTGCVGSGNGGSGVILIKEPAVPKTAPGMWTINEVYDQVKLGEWDFS